MDEHVIIEVLGGERPASSELRDLARVVKAALGVVVAYWKASQMPAQHPYRQAVRMVVCYLERRYHV